MAPLPFGLVTTGMHSASAKACNSGAASASSTPWPAMITGCFAASSRSSAVESASGLPGAPFTTRREATGGVTVASSTNTFSGTSRFTGPGRPDSMRSQAWRTASGTMSTRVGW